MSVSRAKTIRSPNLWNQSMLLSNTSKDLPASFFLAMFCVIGVRWCKCYSSFHPTIFIKQSDDISAFQYSMQHFSDQNLKPFVVACAHCAQVKFLATPWGWLSNLAGAPAANHIHVIIANHGYICIVHRCAQLQTELKQQNLRARETCLWYKSHPLATIPWSAENMHPDHLCICFQANKSKTF